LDKWSRTGSCW